MLTCRICKKEFEVNENENINDEYEVEMAFCSHVVDEHLDEFLDVFDGD